MLHDFGLGHGGLGGFILLIVSNLSRLALNFVLVICCNFKQIFLATRCFITVNFIGCSLRLLPLLLANNCSGGSDLGKGRISTILPL